MAKMFHRDTDGTLQAINPATFAKEADLEHLLWQHPELIPGDAFSSEAPLRFLPIGRQFRLQGADQGGDRWSADHFFLDQYGTPTIVEIKREQNTERRRHVIAQLLDYVANAVISLDVETIRTRFFEANEHPDTTLNQFLSEGDDTDQFWARVDQQLQRDNVRLLVVADDIPNDLVRIVEFLNQQMQTIELTAISLKKYELPDGRTNLVSDALGLPKRNQSARARSGSTWDYDSFIEKLYGECPEPEARASQAILDWMFDRLSRIQWGTGTKVAIAHGILPGFASTRLVSVGSDGGIVIQLDHLKKTTAFETEETRDQLVNEINETTGAKVSLRQGRSVGMGMASVRDLINNKTTNDFLAVLERAVKKVEEAG